MTAEDLDTLRWERIDRAARDTLERVTRALRDRYGAHELPIRVRDAIVDGVIWAAQAGQPVVRPAPRMAAAPPPPAPRPVTQRPRGMPPPPPPRRPPVAPRRQMDVEPWELDWTDHEASTTEFRIDGEETGKHSIRALWPKR